MYLFDLIEPLQFTNQDSASVISLLVNKFHNYIMAILVIILLSVSWLMIQSIISKLYVRQLVDHPILELIWTIIPAIILLLIAFPSLNLLYKIDDIVEPTLTLKAIGNQWYWTYEYGDYENSEIDYQSYMINSSDLIEGDIRLREVDNRVVVPVNKNVKVLGTANDVIHAWALPSLGIKMDCLPGRLNQQSFITDRPGLFAGGCSEICGSEHSYMPIIVEAVSSELFAKWIFSFSE